MIFTNFIYFLSSWLFFIGLLIIFISHNYMKKIFGLMFLQNGVLLFFLAIGKVKNGIIPINVDAEKLIYSSPVPHVLMLTAIVVGFATLAVALAIIYNASTKQREF